MKFKVMLEKANHLKANHLKASHLKAKQRKGEDEEEGEVQVVR